MGSGARLGREERVAGVVDGRARGGKSVLGIGVGCADVVLAAGAGKTCIRRTLSNDLASQFIAKAYTEGFFAVRTDEQLNAAIESAVNRCLSGK